MDNNEMENNGEMSTNVDFTSENAEMESSCNKENEGIGSVCSAEDSNFEENSGVTEDETQKALEYKPVNAIDRAMYAVYRDETLSYILKIICYVAVGLTAYAFLFSLVTLIPEAPMEALRYLIICGVPFAAVSVVRKLVNSPRPYEIYPFYEKKPKQKSGCGYPSRHIFSCFVIAAVLAFENVFLGIGLALLGAVLAVCRVLLGIHFIRDTVAGAVIGVASGILGMYLTHLVF